MFRAWPLIVKVYIPESMLAKAMSPNPFLRAPPPFAQGHWRQGSGDETRWD